MTMQGGLLGAHATFFDVAVLQVPASPTLAPADPVAPAQTLRGPGMDDVTVNTADAFGDINAMFQGALASEAPWQVHMLAGSMH